MNDLIKSIPEENKFKEIWGHILSLDSELFLPDSIKWLMFDYWSTLAEAMLRKEHKRLNAEQHEELERIRKAINYVE